jgi:hypothetical protein
MSGKVQNPGIAEKVVRRAGKSSALHAGNGDLRHLRALIALPSKSRERPEKNPHSHYDI